MADEEDVEETVESIRAQERISSLEMDQDWMQDDHQYFYEEIEQVKRNQIVIYCIAVVSFWYFCYKAGGKIGEIISQVD